MTIAEDRNSRSAGRLSRNPIRTCVLVLSAGTCLMATMAVVSPTLSRAHRLAMKAQARSGSPSLAVNHDTSTSASSKTKPAKRRTPVVAVSSRKDSFDDEHLDEPEVVELESPIEFTDRNESKPPRAIVPAKERLAGLEREVERAAKVDAEQRKSSLERSSKAYRELQQIIRETQNTLEAPSETPN